MFLPDAKMGAPGVIEGRQPDCGVIIAQSPFGGSVDSFVMRGVEIVTQSTPDIITDGVVRELFGDKYTRNGLGGVNTSHIHFDRNLPVHERVILGVRFKGNLSPPNWNRIWSSKPTYNSYYGMEITWVNGRDDMIDVRWPGGYFRPLVTPGEWNECFLLCDGDTYTTIVNREVVDQQTTAPMQVGPNGYSICQNAKMDEWGGGSTVEYALYLTACPVGISYANALAENPYQLISTA